MCGPMDTTPEPRRPAFARWLGTTNEVTRRFLGAGRIPGLINIAGGLPAPELYPAAELAAIARQVIEEHPAGNPRLHADRRTARSARCAGGALQHAGAAAGAGECARHRQRDARARPHRQGPGGRGRADRGAIPDLSRGARRLAAAPAALPPSRPGGSGLDPVAAMQGAQFAYTVPNFSNPTGKLVGLPMRHALVEAAHRTGHLAGRG